MGYDVRPAILAMSAVVLVGLPFPALAAKVAPIITVSNGADASKPLPSGIYDFSINLNPQNSGYNYSFNYKSYFCGGDRNPSGNYCAHDVMDTIVPGSAAISNVTLDGATFNDGTVDNGVLKFTYGSDIDLTSELTFVETFSATRRNTAFFYGNSNPALDGYRTDIGPNYGNAPANFTGSPLSCSFSATAASLVLTTARCSLKLSFVAQVIAPPSDPTSAVPEPATWAMLVGGFGLIGGAMRRHRRSMAAPA